MSAGPPAANGTMMRTGFAGYSCACEAKLTKAMHALSSRRAIGYNMMPPLRFRFKDDRLLCGTRITPSAARIALATRAPSSRSGDCSCSIRRWLHALTYTIKKVRSRLVLRQPVNIGPETGIARIQIARELQVADYRRIDPLAGNQQRDAWRIRRQQHGRYTAFEVVD